MLNNQKNKIETYDYSFNPISGRCGHDCEYCYMKRFWNLGDNAKRQFKEKYLDINLDKKKPSKIFVGSSTDMWGDWVPKEWIQRVLDFAEANPKHIFQFLTKNPKRYGEFVLPKNGWYGTTVDGTDKTKDNLEILFNTLSRIMFDIKLFISFEPLIKMPEIDNCLLFQCLDWIIIGADSLRGAEKAPDEWLINLVDMARYINIPVFIKDNYGYKYSVKEFPDA